jgi:hypothetical protein
MCSSEEGLWMKQLAVVTILVVGSILAWIFGSRLSADAVGMAVGLLFGVLAGIPTALLVLASGRRRRSDVEEEDEEEGAYERGGYGAGGYGRQRALPQQPYGYQPPVIVLAAPQAAPPQWSQGQPQGYPQGYAQGHAQPYPQTVDSVGYPVRQALPGPGAPGTPGGRVFKVVGEREETLDEW